VWIGDVERRRGGEDVAGDSVGGGWVGEVEAKMRSRKVFTGVVRGARTDARFVVRSGFGSTSISHPCPSWQGWD
jgi:hypothetical protein